MDDRWPVSVKGVLGWDDQVVLLRNERNEWELPGGRLESGDASLSDTLQRELHEELGVDAVVEQLLDTWIYEPVPGRRVVIVTYRCEAERPARLHHSDEHSAVGLFHVESLGELALPDGYRRSIDRFATTW